MKESAQKHISETKIKLASAICRQINGKYTKESKGKLIYILSKIGISNVYKIVYEYARMHPENSDALLALSCFDRKESIDFFKDILADDLAYHRDLVIECLGNYKKPELISFIKDYLCDEDRQVRYQAAQALYNIGGKEAALAMCKLVSDPDEWISMTILGLVCRMKENETIPELINQYRKDSDLRRKANMVSFFSIFKNISFLEVFEDALKTKDARLQANAIEAIGNLNLPDEELKRRILPFIHDNNNRIRANAILAMAKIIPNELRSQIIEMCNSQDVQLRRSAAFILGIIPPTSYYKEAEKLIVDKNESVKRRMIISLKNFPHEFISANIRKVLSDKDKWIRKYAVDMVASIPAFESTPIIEILKTEECGPTIESCLKFLVSHPNENAVDSLKVHFKDDRIPVIKALLRALLAVSGIPGVKKYAPMLDQHDPYVVENIATTLLEIGDLATLDDFLKRFDKINNQALLDMMIPTMESIVDLIIKGEKMPPKLLKAFTDGKATSQSVDVPEIKKEKVEKSLPVGKEKTETKVSADKKPQNNIPLEKSSNISDTNLQTVSDYKLEFDFKVSNEPQEIEEEKTDFEIPSFEGLDLSSFDREQEEIIKGKADIPHYQAGLNAYKQRKYKKAMEEFNLSISNNEDAPLMINVYIGMMLYSKNDYEGAINHLNSYLEKNPNNSKVTFLLGKYYKKIKDWQNLINTYQLFIQGDLDADSSPKMKNRIYQDMGTACAILGKNESAIRLLNILSRIEPENAEVAYYLSMALYKQGKRSDAASIIYNAKKLRNKTKALEKQIDDLAQTIRSGGSL